MAFQRRRVHSHQDVGEVARRMHALANVHLKSRDTAQSALRSADFSRIVGESGDLVAPADTLEKMLPASCIPSPESPEKRTTTFSKVLTFVFSNIFI